MIYISDYAYENSVERPITTRITTFTELINFIGSCVVQDTIPDEMNQLKIYASYQYKPLPHNSSDVYDFQMKQPDGDNVRIKLHFSEKMEKDKLLIVS